MKLPVLLLCLIPVGGCAGTLCDAVDFEGHRVERGMSAAQAIGIMGEPDAVHLSLDQLRYVDRFWKYRIGLSRTSEWVWLHVDPVVVAWVEDGRITSLGTLPRAVSVGSPSRTSWMVHHSRWSYYDCCGEHDDPHGWDDDSSCDEAHNSGPRGGWRPTSPGRDDCGNPR